MGVQAWNTATSKLNSAEKFISVLGKEQRTTAKNVGHLHDLSVKTVIYYQPTDGAKNYHECEEFDAALSKAIKKNFKALKQQAIEILKDDVRKSGLEARESVQKMLDQIDAYENT